MAGTPVVINDVCNVRAYTFLDAQLGINNWYFRISATAGTPDVQTVAEGYEAHIAAALKACIATPAIFLGVSARVLGGPGWPTWYSKLLQGAGSGGADPVPKQCAGIFSKITAYGGRKGRGRAYVPFPTESQCEPNGNPTAAYIALINTYAGLHVGNQVLTAGANSVTGNFCLYSNAPGVPEVRPIINITTRDRFATQMRRGDYGRLNAIPPELA